MQKALEILQKYWKHSSFRSVQDQIVQSVLLGNDTFGLLPTGGGKSLCYQVPAMVFDGICLVVSPLVALMKDQITQLQHRDIKAIALTGNIKPDELIQLLDNCQYGNYKFLYLSPERLQQDWVLERIKALPISLIAIDEAHCISQWGHDFRPAYLKIANLKDYFPNIPFIAVTASATPQVQQDIVSLLKLKNPKLFQKSFARDNLGYHILNTQDKFNKIKQILLKNTESSILYVRNRKGCQQYAQQLQAVGITATYYHAGLTIKEKETNMYAWMKDKVQVMVATSAFGMGIDKPNVKTVLHINLPENLESYYQEAGRAGRNGQKAFAILLFSESDIPHAQAQYIDTLPNTSFLKTVYVKLCNYFKVAYGEGFNDEFPFNINKFCTQYQLPIIQVYAALQFLDRQGVLVLSQEFSQKVQVQFRLESRELIRYISLHPDQEPVITAILRAYPGIFDLQLAINTAFIAKKANTTQTNVIDLLEKLEQKEIITLFSKQNESKITFLEIREDDKTINRIAKYLEKQNALKQQQLESVVQYVNNTKTCKSTLLLAYFGEKSEQNCGICSTCITAQTQLPTQVQLQAKILEIIASKKLTSHEIQAIFAINTSVLLQILRQLLEHNIITINSKNQFTIQK